jgi:catechol 2,3-dioxygenase-like lactoylglutathione lyase family enzyme
MNMHKTHISLNVSNLEKSVQFYQILFGVNPVKYKSDYAKFDINNPPLNLTLEPQAHLKPGGTLSHLGIQVESTAAVKAAIQQFQAAELATFEEKDTNCCYALQDKVWIRDPDGNRWEIFVVKVADTEPEINRPSPCCVS